MNQHNTRVEGRGFDHDRTKQYVAVCSCGWKSELQKTERRADNECDDHTLTATRVEK